MKLFVDTNVLFDVLARRDPFYDDSAAVWSQVERGAIAGFVSAISFNNVYDVMRRMADERSATEAVRILRDVFQIVSLDAQVMNQAIGSRKRDFEDAIQYVSALRADADVLVTRNVEDFPRDDLAVLTPAEFLAQQSFL